MAIGGLAVTLIGFLIAAGSVGITASTNGRLGLVLVGIAVSLFGIMGPVNGSYQKNAVWKK